MNGVSITVPTNAALQTAFAQQIFAAATASNTQFVTGAGTVAAAIVLDTSTTGGVLSGTSSISPVQVVLGVNGGLGQTYITNGTAVSTVVTADNSNSTVVNNNPQGALLAQTGSGPNLLYGAAGQNTFYTGNGGNDLVILNGSLNTLVSRGADAVLVGGPSTVTASAGGTDNVLMTTGTTLAFINGSRPPDTDTITGAANGVVVLAGTGNTSVMSGAGPETFFIDTSAGNTTLNANGAPNDAFVFIKDANVGTANITANNFVASDIIQVHGYAGFNVQATAAGGSTLLLSDGSQVTFSNVSAATLQQTIKTV